MDTDDSKLSQLLKDHEPAYIDDAGFTGRVMSALPAQSRSTRNLRRPLLLLASYLLSIPLTLLLAGPEFLDNLSALIQITINKPVLNHFGFTLGALPLACFIAGLGITFLLAYRSLCQALR
jgi:hypothetical protein